MNTNVCVEIGQTGAKLDVIVSTNVESDIVANITLDYFKRNTLNGIFQSQNEYIAIHQMGEFLQRALKNKDVNAIIKVPYKQYERLHVFRLPIYNGKINVPIKVLVHYQGQLSDKVIADLVMNAWDPQRIMDKRVRVLNKISHNISIRNVDGANIIDYRLILDDPQIIKQLKLRRTIHQILESTWNIYIVIAIIGIFVWLM